MTPKQILDSFSETLMRDQRILSTQERSLVATLLHHARTAAGENHETQAAVRAVIASAVGETVAQRAFAVLGGSIVERILENSAVPLNDSGGIRAADPYFGPRPPSQPQGPGEVVRAGNDPYLSPRPPSQPEHPGVVRAGGDPYLSPRPPVGPQPPGEVVRARTTLTSAATTERTGNARGSERTYIGPQPPSGPQTPGEVVRAMNDPYFGPQPPSGPQPPGEVVRTMTDPQSPSHSPGPQPPPPGVKAPVQPVPATPVVPPKDPQPPSAVRTAVVSQTSAAVAERPSVLPAQCVVLDEFLAPQEVDELMRFTLEHEADFSASEVVSPTADGGVINYEHRRSSGTHGSGSPSGLDPGSHQGRTSASPRQARHGGILLGWRGSSGHREQ